MDEERLGSRVGADSYPGAKPPIYSPPPMGDGATSNVGGGNGGAELRARFLDVSIRRRLAQVRQLSVPPPRPIAMRGFTGGLFSVLAWLRRLEWCSQVEDALEDGTKFLSDNWDQLSPEERDGFEKELADLLDAYSEICG
jgi:hypothetical protein